MKRFILLWGVVSAIGALCACSSINGIGGAGGIGARDDGIDQKRVDSVERAAAQTGVRVYWLNLPRKLAAAGG